MGQEWVGYHDSRLLIEGKFYRLSCVLTWTSAMLRWSGGPHLMWPLVTELALFQNCLRQAFIVRYLVCDAVTAAENLLKCQCTVPVAARCVLYFAQLPVAGCKVMKDHGLPSRPCSVAVFISEWNFKGRKKEPLSVTAYYLCENSLHITWSTNKLLQ